MVSAFEEHLPAFRMILSLNDYKLISIEAFGRQVLAITSDL